MLDIIILSIAHFNNPLWIHQQPPASWRALPPRFYGSDKLQLCHTLFACLATECVNALLRDNVPVFPSPSFYKHLFQHLTFVTYN